MQSSDYQNIGQYLKESRESLRVSLAEAAASLHIRVKYLKALENGDLNDLPGKAYVRGYIRNYAQYLRLDVPAVLEAYAFLLGPRAQELFIPEPTLRKNLPTRRVLWLCLAALFLLYGFWYLEFHDRTELNRIVADLPAGFAHLLDKTPPPMMDKAWEICLNGDSAGCYVTVGARLMPSHAVIYDLHRLDSSPQEP
jgi:cytoskeleton protein RodZ